MKKQRESTGCWLPAAMAVTFSLMVMPVPAGAQTQVNDKWITVVVSQEPTDLDGCSSSFTGIVVRHNVVETLMLRTASGDFIPRLATSWERVDDSTWQIMLRQGVTFQDGAPFNAMTAKKSLERSLSKVIACTDRVRNFPDISIEITPADEYTLLIKTSRPDPILPIRLADMGIVSPNTKPDKLVLDAVGTGPYVLDSWQAGVQILLKRNDKYWGPKPQAEGARYLWRSDSSVRAAMVNIGEADIASAISWNDTNDPKMDVSYSSGDTYYIRIDTFKPPLSDKRVRLALNYAIDRSTPIGTLMPKGTLSAAQIVSPEIPGHNFDLDKNPYPYDPAKAKQLLAQAKADGVPVDTEILMVINPTQYAGAGELMEAMASMFRAVGLNVKMRSVEQATFVAFRTKPFGEDRQPLLLQSSHDNTSGDPVFSLDKFTCAGSTSQSCDPSLDSLILKASSLGGGERVKAWQDVFKYAHEETIPAVFLYHMPSFARVSSRIKWVPDITSNRQIRISEITFK